LSKVLVTILIFVAVHYADDTVAFEPTSKYEFQEIEGWTVRVNHALRVSDENLYSETLKELACQLYEINRRVPGPALDRLHEVPIWVEAESSVVGMCYHPSQQWLENNGFNPAKAKSIELGNPSNFIEWTTHQPWMLLHELAHAYHHRVLGWEHSEVIVAYERAMERKAYDNVLHWNGRRSRGYACNNHKEYFAELSEAYFGTNDMYPFVRAELKEHDPEAHELLRKLWNTGSSGSEEPAKR